MSKKKQVRQEQVKLTFIRYHSWPYSVDSGVQGLPETRMVPLSETYLRNGKRYYQMTCGHGTVVELLVR